MCDVDRVCGLNTQPIAVGLDSGPTAWHCRATLLNVSQTAMNDQLDKLDAFARRLNAKEGRVTDPKIRPRDAATLLVVKRDPDAVRILMGKRHEKHKFMPGKFVFPGGRVDPGDSRVRPLTDLDPVVEEKLLARMRGRPSAARARGLAMAALRETFEEAGLIIGDRPSNTPVSRSKGWSDFFQTGVQPTLHNLHFIARAITPPGRNRRFDTRFFAVEADAVQGDMHDLSSASDELLDLHWMTFAEAHDRDIPQITGTVLHELQNRLSQPEGLAARNPVPFYHMQGQRFVCEQL